MQSLDFQNTTVQFYHIQSIVTAFKYLPIVLNYMEFNPRILAFLQYEMKQIKNNPNRDTEDREHASTVLGCIEGELEYREEHYNGETNPTELLP